MTDEKEEPKAPPHDTAATLREEARMPAWRFVVVEFRKLLIPVLTAALAGGGTAFLGWNLHGRDQARGDASDAAQEQVKAMEDLRSWIRDQRESSGSAPVTTTAKTVRQAVEAWRKADPEKREAAERLLQAYEADAGKSGKRPWEQARRPGPSFVLEAARDADTRSR